MPGHVQSTTNLLRLFHQQNKEHVLILLDPEGKVLAWLAASQHVFGYTAEEMLGQSLERLFTPEDRALKLFEHELAVARSDGHAEDDRWKICKDGSRIWVYGVLIGIRDEAGQIIGFGKILRNRTDIKSQIETLENRIELLRREAEQRTGFLGTLAHELRNPLAPIATAVEIIRQVGGPQLYATADLVKRQISHLQRLVDDLMDASRINSGKVRLAIETVNLQEILTAAADVCRNASELRHQTFKTVYPEVGIVFEGDSARLKQVFINLFQNAIKYTPPGGNIWVKATVEGSEVVVRIQDTGVGIATEMLPLIFDMFTQEDASLNRCEGGLGIGLALVKDLVNRHGGTVSVRSDGKGKGSEFSVRLPLMQPPSSQMNDRPHSDGKTGQELIGE